MGTALLIILISLATFAGLLGHYNLSKRIWVLKRQLQHTELLVIDLIARNSAQGGEPTTRQDPPRERI